LRDLGRRRVHAGRQGATGAGDRWPALAAGGLPLPTIPERAPHERRAPALRGRSRPGAPPPDPDQPQRPGEVVAVVPPGPPRAGRRGGDPRRPLPPGAAAPSRGVGFPPPQPRLPLGQRVSFQPVTTRPQRRRGIEMPKLERLSPPALRTTTVAALLAAAALAVGADGARGVAFKVDEAGRRVDVTIDGKPFTSYICPNTLNKPLPYPIPPPP